MLIDEFDYHLPQEAIAQKPAVPRDMCKLMVIKNGIRHHLFYEILEYLGSGDVVVVNDTRVIHARIHARKKTGGKIEILLLGNESNLFKCLVKGKVREGTKMLFDGKDGIEGEIVDKNGGECLIDIPLNMAELEAIGEMPLPPYIKEKVDRETAEMYQSVYAREKGSVAAPTAGLHFTKDMLDKMRAKGVKVACITLHVGIGTFMPVRCRNVEEHRMEAEYYEIDDGAAQKINDAGSIEANVIAVGTTTVKTLESSANADGSTINAGSGWSDLFIYPGYKFNSPITGVLTNFHLPKSTPLLLVCAYAGKDNIMRAYNDALKHNYRFLSFGDAMLIMDKNV
ncbi:MAG: tRNA preQ1(34) S-adenosylmethionine ribosyltransferase-isomerase QueA [Candidatus Thermoplasmatota archaeon]|nr:tRNA preQ1(34) S-adenosylmethionine ribosyltransferase-isomerase QueA [Candidatus Thermoplasmatota archaeon]